jgi:hypothetical protein
MTITSFGYAGTVEAAQWARLAPYGVGYEYGVMNRESWRPTIGGGTRQVQIAAGVGFGKGVMDESSAVEIMSFSSVPTGSRWDLVVARRTWATKTTQFVVVPGGSAKQLPSRQTNAGVVDDQPIALVRVQASQASVQEIVDLRVLPRIGGAFAYDNLVRTYMGGHGTQLLIGDTLYQAALDASGAGYWATLPFGDTGWMSSGGHFVTPSSTGFRLDRYRIRKIGGHVAGMFDVTRTANTELVFNASGDIGSDPGIGSLVAGFRPQAYHRPAVIRDIGSREFFGQVEEGGAIRISHGPVNARIRRGDQLRAYVDFTI